MLSVTSATVHRSMCPGTPNSSSSQRPERNGTQSWNCEYSVMSSHCRGPGATTKSLTVRSIDAVDLNIDLKHKNDIFDNLKSPTKFEPIDRPTIKHDSSSIVTGNKHPNPFYKKGPLNTSKSHNEGVKIDEITSEDNNADEDNNCEENKTQKTDATCEKRKRDSRSRTPKSVKFMKMSEMCKIQSKPDNEMKNFFNELTGDETVKEVEFDQEEPTNQLTNVNWNDWEGDTNSRTEDPFDENSFHPDTPYYMIGFPNPPGENRCWLNATLHALFALPLIDKLDRLDLNGCSKLTKTLIAMQLFWREGPIEKQKTYQIVTKFKDELGILDSSYPSELQQDVSEFLMIFLNYVKTDCENLISNLENSATNKCQEKSFNENTKNTSPYAKSPLRSPRASNKRSPLTPISPFKRRINFNENSDRQNEQRSVESKTTNNLSMTKIIDQVHTNDMIQRNPIDEFFLLRMMEHYVCQDCSNHRQRKVDNLMLYVDLPENELEIMDLTQSIKKSMETEERALSCGKCKGQKHDVYTSFRRSPNVLIVQIKRYGMTSDGFVAKINTPVHIPEALTLETNTDELTNDCVQGEVFVPVCMIAHVGAAMDCGHYTSYVKHVDQWFHYNDLNVMPMSSSEAFSAAESTAYVVFFVNAKLLTETSGYTESEETLR